MSDNSLPSPRLGTLKHLAQHRHVSERTTRNWAAAGYLTLYRIKGVQGVVVDLDAADATLDALAKTGKVRPDYGSFNGAEIRDLIEPVQR